MGFPPFQKAYLIYVTDSHYIFYAVIRQTKINQTKNNKRELICTSGAAAYYILDPEYYSS
jgi:hypothetical protein